ETLVGQGLISDDTIERIKSRVDIADIVSQHVSLSRAGQNLKGLCPFHHEKTPSFTVSPSKQIFHCFGCGAGGNVFTFLSRLTGASFPEVVRDLGQTVGIEIEERASHSSPQSVMAQTVERINQAATAWFQTNLRDERIGRQAREYLAHRGVESCMVDRFGIGVAPAEWDGLLRALTKKGFSQSDLASAGLVIARTNKSGFYDRFRARVMFTITDLRKRVVGFGGRVLGDDTPKYLNSSDTVLFKKSHTLFALDHAREAIAKTKTVIVVEGYFDAIALHQAGLTHTVATLGTAFTSDHVQALRRFASNVVLLFDPDPAGVRAALRGLDLFVNSGMSVKVVTLPVGEDPDTYVRKEGPEAFARLEEQAPSLLDFALEQSLKATEVETIEGRIRSVDELLRILQKSEHPIEREERLKVVAERLGISQARLIERYPILSQQHGRDSGRPRQVVAGATPMKTLFKGAPEERDLAVLLLRGMLSAADVRRLKPDQFSVGGCRRLVELALDQVDRDGRIRVQPLLGRLMDDPECGVLATDLSLRDDHFDDESAHAKACLDRLDRKRSDQTMRELITRMKAAEREGRADEVGVLNMEINAIRMRKAGVPTAGIVSLVKE
ncbi:MAG: DNA primase, partial [Nitrospira sp. WS110]|nr:DNA primase [Nitrospira sp. WS110]